MSPESQTEHTADRSLKEGCERLALTGSVTPLDPLVTATCRDILSSGGSIGLACSGGADSVYLVCRMKVTFPEYRSSFVVFHFNHRTRGPRSDFEMDWVSSFARGMDLGFRGKTAIRPLSNENEGAMRRCRIHALHEMAANLGIELVLTGHHRDDRVESLLIRLSSGSPPESLAVPRRIQSFKNGISHGRPLWAIPREILRNQLSLAGIPWLEDSSNGSDRYYRNQIRNRLLPLWENLCPHNLRPNLLRTVSQIEDDANALEYYARQAFETLKAEPGKPIRLSGLSPLPTAIQRRVLRAWLPIIPIRHLEGILECIRAGQVFSLELSPGLLCTLREGFLRIEHRTDHPLPDWSETPWHYLLADKGHCLIFPNGKILSFAVMEAEPAAILAITSGSLDPASEVALDADRIGFRGALTLSRWAEGDRWQPLGSHGHQKIQDAFVNRKILSGIRPTLPVVRVSGQQEILWIPGLPPSESGRVDPLTKHLLRLTYR